MCNSDIGNIVFYPDPILRARARDVTDVASEEVHDVIRRLTKTMAEFDHCVGLAANQIGSDLNIFVADASKNMRASSEYGLVVVINPLIVEHGNPIKQREGCMSVPDLTGNVTRAQHVIVAGIDPEGKSLELVAHDFEARVFQHEIDHVMGKVFLDRVTTARDVFTRRTYRS